MVPNELTITITLVIVQIFFAVAVIWGVWESMDDR